MKLKGLVLIVSLIIVMCILAAGSGAWRDDLKVGVYVSTGEWSTQPEGQEAGISDISTGSTESEEENLVLIDSGDNLIILNEKDAQVNIEGEDGSETAGIEAEQMQMEEDRSRPVSDESVENGDNLRVIQRKDSLDDDAHPVNAGTEDSLTVVGEEDRSTEMKTVGDLRIIEKNGSPIRDNDTGMIEDGGNLEMVGNQESSIGADDFE